MGQAVPGAPGGSAQDGGTSIARAWGFAPWLGPVIALAGVVLATIGANSSSNTRMIVGGALALAGLLLINRLVRRFSKGRELKACLIGAVAIIAGLVGVGLGLIGFVQPLAGAGVALVILGALPIAAALRRAEAGTARGWWIAGGIVGSALGLLLAWRVNALVGLVVFAAALVALKIGLADWTPTGAWIPWTWFGLAVVGAVTIVGGTTSGSGVAAVTGGYLLLLGLLGTTKTVDEVGPLPWLVLAVLGLLVGTFQWLASGVFGLFGTFVVLGLAAVLGVSFVIRGESLLFLLVAGLAVIWVSADREDELDPELAGDAEVRILALGDSYTSGEGAEVFFENTNEKGGDGDQCRRSPTAYPVLVANELETGLDFLACSGAKTVALDKDGVRDETEPNDLVAQLDAAMALPKDVKDSIGLVLLSIGGNDAEFGDIGKACLVPGSCKQLRQLWLENVGQIGARIADSYTDVRDAFPGAAVLVVPYPLLIDVEACEYSLLGSDEHEFLAEFISVLDDQLLISARRAGVHFVEDALFAFDDEQICDGDGPDDSAMNVINVNPVNGSLSSRLNPTNWFHGSLHPKARGHRLVADAVNTFIEREVPTLTAGERSTTPVNPDPDPTATFELRGIAGATRLLFNPDDVPSGAPCSPPRPLASRAQVIDRRAAILLDGADVSPLCFLGANGIWRQVDIIESGEPATDDGGISGVTLRVGDQAVELPEPTAGFRQYVLYSDDGETSNLLLVDFCDRDTSCDVGNVTQWRNERVAEALRRTIAPTLIVLLSSWLLAMVLRPRVRKRAEDLGLAS